MNDKDCYDDDNNCFCDYEGSSHQSPGWKGPGYYRFMEPAGKIVIY